MYKYEFYYPYTSIFDENVDTSKREDMHGESFDNNTFSHYWHFNAANIRLIFEKDAIGEEKTIFR